MSGYILLGSPGSGKGTLGQFMKSFGVEHIASGDILRREVRKGTLIGRQTQQLIQEGLQVPDQLISEIVLKKLEECIEKRSQFVLDGFPQTVAQFESLYTFLTRHPDYPVTTICVDIKPETALKRMSGRISCPECESIYHQEMHPPVKEGQCDRCDSLLVQRESDIPEQAVKRLEQFELTTKKVMECALQRLGVFSIDGNGSMESSRAQLIDLFQNSLCPESR